MRFYMNRIRMICDRNAMTYEWHANGIRFYAKKSKEKKRKAKQIKQTKIKKQNNNASKFVCKILIHS